ncbi:MAG TPA: glycosyltransferase 87 family protein [Thermoleophilaceae bacterium]|nr:glycosyltransferase 87 family protein [Thermoleophilaceae bacterium]
MELPHRALARLSLAALLVGAALLAAAALPAGAAAADLQRPASETKPPRFFERSARDAERIAARADKVRAARRDGALDPTAYTKGVGRWQVSYFRNGREVVQVQVDDRSGAVIEQWSGDQVAWTMARGYPGAFGRKLNAPYVWIPLCVLFLAPFVDVRRPLRLLHLDLLVLLAFGVSHVFFNRGEIGVSAPLVYPVLLYLLVRVLLAAFRPRRSAGPLVPHAPLTLLVVGLVFLTAFRIGLNVADSNVIDVGYAGVVGADRIVDGDSLYGEGFSDDVERGDTYGPVNYLLYVPFEQAMPWSGRWDDLPAAHGAAIAFDLLALGGLLLLGRRLRPGRDGVALGVALGYAWVAYPYTAFALESNSNDSLVALGCVGALLAASLARDYAAGLFTGVAMGLSAAAKFVTLALAPLFARRSPIVFAAALLLTLVATVAPFVPDGGLRELYDRTIGYQASRPSPFSIWGQVDSLDWLQTALKVGAAALALLVAFVPRRPDLRQTAALGAAVLIAVQLAATHWFYLYVVWFVPFVFVALFAAHGRTLRQPSVEAAAEREPVYA